MYIWKHFCTITNHKILVAKYCFRVGLYRQGLMHDMSKYSWTEFSRGCKYWQGFQSPNNAEREEKGASLSWLHHQGRNKHHFEYWVDYGIGAERILAGVPMPRKYIAEMVMDRISASRVYLGEDYTPDMPYRYYKRGRKFLWFIHEKTDRELGFLLWLLKEKGEDYMIRYIKHSYLKGKPLPEDPKKRNK